MEQIFQHLKSKIKGEVLTDAASLGMYSTDASIYQIKPIAIVLPKDADDVGIAINTAYANNMAILPRGAGTSLAGQTVGESMILDFSKYMNAIIKINETEKWVRVQPGMARDDLNAVLAPLGLHFAPDPATSSRANVGGMVGNNSSGTKSVLFGKTVDHILEAHVILAEGTLLNLKNYSPEEYQKKASQNNREGEIYKTFKDLVLKNKEEIKARFPKVMRRVGGYNLDEFVYTDDWNLSKLICGSEGTLATTVELKLNLVDLPKHKSVCVVHFAELLEAISAVESMLKFNPSAVEILDKTVVGLSRENLLTKHHCHFIEGHPAAILIVEFYGDTEADVLHRPQKMIAHLKENNFGYAYPLFPEGKSYDDVWVVRKKGLGLMLGLKGNKKPLPFIEDAGIPSESLPEYIDEVLKVCEKYGTKAAMYAHASVGVIHVRPILDLRLAEDIERLKNITEDTFQLVMKYKGSWSGEHGDGLVRSAYNKRFFGDTLYNAFIDIKKLMDPKNLMNPGKIIEAQTIEHNLRYGVDYKDETVKTEYNYKTEEGFEAAVHMCSGVGECRKVLGGTMCPSFKATRDEEHSTRGRANALRLAMSNQLGANALSGKRLHEVMDLCLSCKACKSECPSNVDMAKMKSDVLQMYYDQNGISFRDKLIRDSSKAASKISGATSGLVNTIQKSSIFKYILEKTAGFDKRRTLPNFAKEPFYKWFEKNAFKTNKGSKKVVLFADTYLNYHEPQIGISALELLNSCGYEVVLANVGCCQRPKISHGFLRDAKKEGAKTIEGLKPFLDQGLKVVVCEPSCASALNDDLPDLISSQETAEQLKNGVMMIDVFLSDEYNNGRLDVDFEPVSEHVAIHGHCHQKALYGTNAMKSLLKNSKKEVSEIPSGCCGMAGSFGYEKEHYDLSKKIGNEILFPAVNKLKKDSELVACGFSCRHQIEHFTEAKPKHFVEVIRAIKK
ncbi:FAD-binding and (Fe-S)-binding domain-containing protein [Hwangdonia lutea]|uniref:FAD-linked oxidase C-terminal domain-containing protein n=1 Tax=Hwangdonia lutea TaxID=3075823 RepID=A0AA97HRI4_9FLAO|nr:FAD-linked oxidase C-terminal domain-containing protein [Hwangdonia sp. SCSIO 19198]WOD43888.1 FAD-linked oxidase C-terminal domain-containing protein [Hwangdonia sp. SCSIO 19198]